MGEHAKGKMVETAEPSVSKPAVSPLNLDRQGEDRGGDLGEVAVVKCWCCGTAHVTRGADDPWDGRMLGYCYECSLSRCDAYPGECPVKHPEQYVERVHAAWFAHCDLCMKFRLRVYWWTYCDSSCKRCLKRYGNWDAMKKGLRHGS